MTGRSIIRRMFYSGVASAAVVFAVALFMGQPITDSFIDINSGQIREVSSVFGYSYRTAYAETWVYESRTPTDTPPDWNIFRRAGG